MLKKALQHPVFYLFATATTLKAIIILSSTNLVGQFFADDAFYYYSLVQNILAGKGIVFNVGIVTNGFHPLYTLFLLPLFSLLNNQGANIPILGSLLMLNAFSIATGWFIYKIVGRLTNTQGGIISLIAWLFNPFIFYTTSLGLEGALQQFFLGWLIWHTMKDNTTLRSGIFTGILAAMTILSRLDGILLIAPYFLYLIITRNKKKSKQSIFKDRYLIATAITSAIILTPYLLWSYLSTSSILPISGEAMRLIKLSTGIPLWRFYLGGIATIILYFCNNFLFIYFPSGLLGLRTLPYPALLVTAELLAGLLFIGLPSILTFKKTTKNITPLYPWLTGLILLWTYYIFRQLGFRQWYSLSTSFFIIILFGIIIINLSKRISTHIKPQRFFIASLTILIIIFSISTITFHERGFNPHEALKVEKAKWMDEHLPENTIIGSFNTGIYQYYTPHHDVINLDGVMNPESYNHLKEGTIDDYIIEKNITIIADENASLPIDRDRYNIEIIKTFTDTYHYLGTNTIARTDVIHIQPSQTQKDNT